MKHLLSVFALFLFLHSDAALWQVNNEPGAAADFSSLTDAISAASSGDTIYLYPGTNSYGNITLNKQLFILGTGHKVDYTTMTPLVGAITFTNGSTGTVIKGIRMWYITTPSGITSNDVLISGCEIAAQNPFSLTGDAIMNAWIIEGCVVWNQSNGMAFNGPNVQNWILRNNIINLTSGSGEFIKYATNMLVENNILIQTGSSAGNSIFGPQCTGVTFRDNIVYYTISIPLANTMGSCTSCILENNITYSPNTTLANLPGTNQNNTDPVFVNVPSSNPEFSYTKDFHLAAGSPAIGSGTAGDDIGVFGGIHAFRPEGWSNTMPRVGNLIPLNNSAPPGGQLLFNLKAGSAGN
ncbi:MAG: hypothetical protein RL220_423 [Bacteroidota bacterium]